MSVQLQLAIPMFAAAAALTVIAILRRYRKPEAFTVCLCLLGLGTFMTVSELPLETPAQDQSVQVSQISDADAVSLIIAQHYMLEGYCSDAMEILDDLRLVSAEDPQLRLATARCYVLDGNYAAAVQLYGELDSHTDEQDAARSVWISQLPNNNALIAALEAQGRDPGVYNLSLAQTEADPAALLKVIRENIQDELEQCEDRYGEDVFKAAELAVRIDEQFRACVGSGVWDSSDIPSQLKKLRNAMDGDAALLANKHLRLAVVKGCILSEDYSQLAAMTDENASEQELIILVELYLSGLISGDDFSDGFLESTSRQRERVLDACREVLDACEDQLSGEDASVYKKKISYMEQQTEDPALYALKDMLLDKAQNGSESMRSKDYLALAKIEQSQGNEENARSYISDALGTAASSDDENYRVPMTQMLEIVQGTADSEEVKNVAQYVDQALDNALPLELEQLDDGTVREEFGQELENDVNQGSAALNIGTVDTGEFPTVRARVQIQSGKWDTHAQLTENLLIYDCGSTITDFTLEKIEFQRSRIILLCDVSGSMGGSESALQDAIRSFAANMQEGEEVCVIGFNDGITFTTDFSSDPETVAGYADKIYTGGNTALYASLLNCATLLEQDINTNNVLIAMTDGQDNIKTDEGTMRTEIGKLAAARDLTVYTLGIGYDVDTAYLETMAQSGNGSFLYVDSVEKLEAFYSFIHGQLNHQYLLTFEAKNKTRNERKLELELQEEIGGAEKTYYLEAPEYESGESAEAYNPYVATDADLTVTGFDAKFLYTSSVDQTLRLLGTGFDAGDDITVRLTGSIRYELQAEFSNETTYLVTVPKEISTGTYDLSVSVAGETFILSSELTVAANGTRRNFQYGDYSFTALSSRVDENGATVLSGDVIMNGWLRFKGDLTVQPDYSNTSRIRIVDENGAYVTFRQDTSFGLANYMAEKGTPLSFAALGTFWIFTDKYDPLDCDSFPTETFQYPNALNVGFLSLRNFGITLYPDNISFNGITIDWDLPFQKQLLRELDLTDMKFVNLDGAVRVNCFNIDLFGEVEYGDQKDYRDEDFSLATLPLIIDSIKISADTMKGNYVLGGSVMFKSLIKNKDAGSFEGIGLTVTFQGNRFEGWLLETDSSVHLTRSPVPVTMGDFFLGASGYSKNEQDSNLLNKILGDQITAGFDLNVAKLKDEFPKIAELLDADDMSAVTFDKCSITVSLRKFLFQFDATAKLFGQIEVGECHVKLGNFSYTNELIGLYGAEEQGFQFSLTQGVELDNSNVKFKLRGTGEFTLGSPYSGAWYHGEADFEIPVLLLFSANFDVEGDAMFGIFKNSLNKTQLSLIMRGQDSNGFQVGFHLYFVEDSGLKAELY